MQFTESLTELTTGTTDAALAIECVVIMVFLRNKGQAGLWRVRLWRWVFGLLAFSSFLGSLVHGLKMPDSLQLALWQPLYLSLGLLVALLVVGAVADVRGWAAAKRLLPWGFCAGMVFFGVTRFQGGSFLFFIVYEMTALVGALLIYTFLAVSKRLKGAGVMAGALAINLVAAGVQASPLSFHLLFPFDHNGVFHLVQMLGAAALGMGVDLGMALGLGRDPSEPAGPAK